VLDHHLQPRRVPHLLGHRCDLHVIVAANSLPSILSETLLSAAFIGASIHHPTIDYSATLSSATSVHLLSSLRRPRPQEAPKLGCPASPDIRPLDVASNASGGGGRFEGSMERGRVALSSDHWPPRRLSRTTSAGYVSDGDLTPQIHRSRTSMRPGDKWMRRSCSDLQALSS
jgi:hypothetical protein